MKNKTLTVILLIATVISLGSCASRKYGCPATAKASTPSLEKQKA